MWYTFDKCSWVNFKMATFFNILLHTHVYLTQADLFYLYKDSPDVFSIASSIGVVYTCIARVSNL